MRVFVTGGYGLIGSSVVRRLISSGHQVVCLVRPGARTHRIDGLEWARVEGDVAAPGAVRQGARGCQAVIHLACPSAWSEIEGPGIETLIARGVRNVVEASEGQARVVFVSSLAAIGPAPGPAPLTEEPIRRDQKLPGMSYAYAKARAEAACRQYAKEGRDVVIVNPAETYGPGDDKLVTAGNLAGLLSGPVSLVCRGGTCIAHVDDVAAGIVAAMENGHSGERYILGGDNLDHESLARLTLEIAGKRQPVVTVPNAIFRWATRAASAIGAPLPYHRNIVPYATRYWFVDNAKAARELDVRFRSARETLEPTIDWMKTAGHIQ